MFIYRKEWWREGKGRMQESIVAHSLKRAQRIMRVCVLVTRAR